LNNNFKYIGNNRRLIVGIGSALVDILTHEEEDFLLKTGAVKGGMTLVAKEDIERTLAISSGTPSIVSGGSACNTIVGIGKLGGKARFIGKCGNGDMGNLIENDLRRQNVEPALFRSDSPTGRVLSIITPDAQRSMFTYLGASAETRPEEISINCFKDAAIVHVEGYLLFNPDLIQAALWAAKEAGAKISLDLASFTVVEESKELLTQLVENYVKLFQASEMNVWRLKRFHARQRLPFSKSARAEVIYPTPGVLLLSIPWVTAMPWILRVPGTCGPPAFFLDLLKGIRSKSAAKSARPAVMRFARLSEPIFRMMGGTGLGSCSSKNAEILAHFNLF
jgi:hypothetical protein